LIQLANLTRQREKNVCKNTKRKKVSRGAVQREKKRQKKRNENKCKNATIHSKDMACNCSSDSISNELNNTITSRIYEKKKSKEEHDELVFDNMISIYKKNVENVYHSGNNKVLNDVK